MKWYGSVGDERERYTLNRQKNAPGEEKVSKRAGGMKHGGNKEDLVK